jgi:glycosyltransferase involved in cell wall biosynthesis
MRVALTAEGTYPHQFGGVSVWTDQLIRGMPDYEFDVLSLVATGSEPVRWELPDNVRSVKTVPLWGPLPSVSLRARLSRSKAAAPVRELIDLLLTPVQEDQDRFGDVLHEMFDYAQSGNLAAAVAGEAAVAALSDAWQERWPGLRPGVPGELMRTAGAAQVIPTLHDAIHAMQLIEHCLRPLSYPPMEADVVHAVTNGLGALPALGAKWRHGMPMLVTEHGVYMREQYLHTRQLPHRWPVKDLFLRFLRRLCTLGYQQAELITPGNVYNKRWEEQLGADVGRVRTVYNGVDPADFPAMDSEPDVPTISWAGRIDPVKDLETLLRAFALVRKEMPDARLRIFGAAPQGRESYLKRCRALAAELQISEQTVFEGRVTDIRDAYEAGQVVVLCSISEGFPYTLIEAMTCGRPCVATDVGGVTEALGDTGIVVSPRSPDALAKACLTLLRDPELRRRKGTEARLRALEFFTVDRAISAFDEIYTFLGTGQLLPAAGVAHEPAHALGVAPAPVPPAGGDPPPVPDAPDAGGGPGAADTAGAADAADAPGTADAPSTAGAADAPGTADAADGQQPEPEPANETDLLEAAG